MVSKDDYNQTHQVADVNNDTSLRIGKRTSVTSSFCLFMTILGNKYIKLKIRATAESQVFDVT